MKYDEFITACYESSPEEWIFNDERGVYVWKNDLNVRILRNDRNDDEDDDEFDEPWVRVHPDKSAHKVLYALYYAESFIKEELFIAVDGYRAYIPIPKGQNQLEISQRQFKLGLIINSAYGNSLSEYLNRSKITIKD